ncbi:unnamed protein product [Rotaria sp. Silwood1]|nr:unnamed protein product [Rotaria sp. Silwood1]
MFRSILRNKFTYLISILFLSLFKKTKKLRDAARKLLEKELDHLHNDNDAWYILISKWSNLFHQSYNKENDGALHDPNIQDILLDDTAYNNDTTTTIIMKEEYKRQQLLSIIFMGIICARYEQEVEHAKQSSVTIKGFSVESPEIILNLSHILASLLSPSNFDHIPLHTAIRRTAIDLIGRGYTTWESYLDIGQVLLALFDLCSISDTSTMTSKVHGEILSPKTDTCLTAQTALYLIATSRSRVVITTLAREIAKHALVQSGTTSSSTSITVKNEHKPEILRLIQILIEKCPQDIEDLILEVVVDITLNCIDLNILRQKGVPAVSETFGLLLKYPTVTYCHSSPKLCVAKHALVQSGTTSSPTSITVKNEHKPEILRLIQILIEKCPQDIEDLILEVIDITLNCIDLNILRQKGVPAVSETFGLLLKFHVLEKQEYQSFDRPPAQNANRFVERFSDAA